MGVEGGAGDCISSSKSGSDGSGNTSSSTVNPSDWHLMRIQRCQISRNSGYSKTLTVWSQGFQKPQASGKNVLSNKQTKTYKNIG